ncbi:hypothetical protein A3B57_02985 [Microgenomates group bacterium RIFCSPLOWO2_01_FULL_47_10]|nr:MAG: hypothetical protein A3B57_02985 [Microgenomates group bacterium RIFCSPLOWO2_01_FULL_47_10]
MSITKTGNRQLYEKFHKESNPISVLPLKNNFTYRHIFDFLEKNIDFNKQKKILDIGCGVGSISFYISNNFPDTKIIGIDISKKAISACLIYKKISRSKNTEFLCSSFEELKINNNQFDLIIASEVIEHIKEDHAFIKKAYKALKPDGMLFITTPSINAPLFRLGMLNRFDERVGHLRRYSFESLSKAIKSNELIIKSKKFNEGILRNILFTNKIGGILLRAVNRIQFLNNIITITDNALLRVFGESNIFLLSKKQ